MRQATGLDPKYVKAWLMGDAHDVQLLRHLHEDTKLLTESQLRIYPHTKRQSVLKATKQL